MSHTWNSLFESEVAKKAKLSLTVRSFTSAPMFVEPKLETDDAFETLRMKNLWWSSCPQSSSRPKYNLVPTKYSLSPSSHEPVTLYALTTVILAGSAIFKDW